MKVIEKSVLHRGANGDLDMGVQFFCCHGEDMGCIMAN